MRRTLYITGTKKRVKQVAKSRTPDHGAAQRGILFPTLAEPQRHRQHPDDHGKRRHQDGAQAGRSGREGGVPGIFSCVAEVIGKGDEQDAVRRCDPDAHDRRP